MEVVLSQFKKSLIASGLMTSDEVEAFTEKLPADNRPKDGAELAKILVRHKKLTKFQAQAIFQGKTKGLLMGDYVILDRIGEGGMGQVYKARHKVMKRVVALKTLPTEATKLEAAVKRFHREVEVAARLSHPNIVTAHDAGEAHGTHYLVMELVEGDDLANHVRQHGRLPVQTALDYTLQAARGLEYAHNRNVVHRDIKPSNLVLDAEGTVKVLDMGLARLNETIGLDDSTGQQTLTGTGQAMGTIDYMPPEQAENVKTADERSDIYSLGCTLHYFLTGRSVYGGDTTIMRLLAHRDADIPSLRAERPDVPEHLDVVFHKMVAKKPEDRFASMTEVIAELEKCAAPKPDEFAETADLGSVPLASARAETQSLLKSDETPGDESLMLGLPVVSPVETMRRRMPKKDNKVLYGAIGAVVCLLVLVVGLFIALKPAGEEVAGRDKTVSVEKKQVAEATTPRIDPKTNNGDQSPSTSVMPVVSTRSGTNWSLEFDGKTSYVQTPLKYDGTHPITIEAIVKPYETEGKADIVVNSSGTDGFYLIRYGAFLQIGTVARRSIAFVQSTSHVNSGQMMHLAAVIDNHEARLYFDGTTEVRKGDIVCRNGRSDVAVRIGATATLNTTKFWGFHGIIDEVRISNIARYTEDFIPQRRFEPDENTMALYHFDEGSGDVLKDSSGNGHDGKIVGATWVKVDEGLKTESGQPNSETGGEVVILPNGWSFGKPVNLGPNINTSGGEGRPAPSSDGLTLFFGSDRPGGQGGADLWMCTRTSVSDPFGEPVNLGSTINTSFAEGGSAPSSDGLTLFFDSDRPGGHGDGDLWMSTRKSVSDPFGEPVNLGPAVNSGSREDFPAISSNSLMLLFRLGENGGHDIWMSTRKSVSDPFGERVKLGPPINTSFSEGYPALSSDGLMLLLYSDRPGGQGVHDLWMSTRKSTIDSFGEPVNLGPTVNTSDWEGGPALSSDGLTLFFASDRPGGQGGKDLWMARIERPGKTASMPPNSTTPPLAIAPFTPEEAKQHQKAWADHLGVPVEFSNGIGMKMVLIPPGEFMMGSTEEEIEEVFKEVEKGRRLVEEALKGRLHDKLAEIIRSEGPQHKVRITEPIYLAAHEVTVGQFKAFVESAGYKTDAETGGKGGSWKNPVYEQTNQHPVVNVSWNDAVAFCEWLKEKEGKAYRLPSEAQWEYACRSGSTTRWFFGDNETELNEYGWCGEGIRYKERKVVGQKLPNGFGVFDMYGNVSEWCSDWLSTDYYNSSPVVEPTGPSSGLYRVTRGGSVEAQPWGVRSAFRNGDLPSICFYSIGFRSAQTIPLSHLTLNITEPNATISIDNGQSTFITPDDAQPIETILTEGKHTIEVSKAGFKTFKKEISVVADGRETVEVELEPVAGSTLSPVDPTDLPKPTPQPPAEE